MASRTARLVPLDFRDPLTAWSAGQLLTSRPRGIGWLTLRHALLDRRPGLWGDHAITPGSAVALREGDGQLEAFGMGDPSPAVDWLVGLDRPVSLLAPAHWSRSILAAAGTVDCGEIATWLLSDHRSAPQLTSPVAVHRLHVEDAEAFAASVPSWAARAWRSSIALVQQGATFGVPIRERFASLAWIFDEAESFAAVGVHTVPRYRRLGLARAAASALVDHLIHERRATPLWATSTNNTASQSLAAALGFAPRITEALFHWPPRPEVSWNETEEPVAG